MATHKIKYKLLVKFDDGTERKVPFPKRVYYYEEQKFSYWVMWVEELIKKENITAKPIEIREVNSIIECERYPIRIGV